MSYDITAGDKVQAADLEQIYRAAGPYAADAGSTDSYAVTVVPAPSSLIAGMVFRFKANTTNDGACSLNVNTLGAIAIKKNLNKDLSTGDILAGQIVEVEYDGTNFQLLSVYNIRVTPEQDIPYYAGTTTGHATTFMPASTQNGDVLFIAYASSGDVIISRLEKDPGSQQYTITHTVTHTGVDEANNISLAATTSFLYLCYLDGANSTIRRFDLADLANNTSITISGTTFNGRVAFSDGTDLYIRNSESSGNTVFNKYTISGTTATFSTTVTYNGSTSGTIVTVAATCDGNNVYIAQPAVAPSIVINKYALTGGSSLGSKTRRIYTGAYPNNSPNVLGSVGLYISGVGLLGIAFGHTISSDSTVTGAAAKLNAIASF